MLSLARNGYSAAAVGAALHASNRQWRFRYDVHAADGSLKGASRSVLSGTVRYNSLADIKRTARLQIVDDGTIDFLSDTIKVYASLRMPDGGWAEFPVGVFVLPTPPRTIDAAGVIIREVEAYDLGQRLGAYGVLTRFTSPAGANYIAEVKRVLDAAGLTAQNLTPTDRTLPEAMDWPPGTTGARIVADLLAAINYRSIWWDGDGVAHADPYVSPAQRAAEYVYRADGQSVVLPEAEQALDLFGIPNAWVGCTMDPALPPLLSSYTNDNPDSPTSTVNRGYTYLAPLVQLDAVTQADVDAQLARIAFEASQVYEPVKFDTLLMPFHSHADVYTLIYPAMGIDAKYSETSWELPLQAGGRMKHECRRVVSI